MPAYIDRHYHVWLEIGTAFYLAGVLIQPSNHLGLHSEAIRYIIQQVNERG